jgi:hypothetical protein
MTSLNKLQFHEVIFKLLWNECKKVGSFRIEWSLNFIQAYTFPIHVGFREKASADGGPAGSEI